MISDDSDVEEITPPLIAHNPVMSTNEAMIATSAFPKSTQNTLSFILNEGNVSPVPICLTGLSSHPPPTEVTPLLSGPPPLPLLTVLDLRDKENQVYWDFMKDRHQAAKVAEVLCAIVRACNDFIITPY